MLHLTVSITGAALLLLLLPPPLLLPLHHLCNCFKLAYDSGADHCREPLFNSRVSDEELLGMLLGYKPLPWEGNPAHISQHVHSQAAGHLVRHLLR